MTTITTQRPAAAQTAQFALRMNSMLDEAGAALMVSIGHRRGLFAAMQGQGWVSPESLAAACGTSESLVTDWLDCMHAAGIVRMDGEHGSYQLPEEYAAVLISGNGSFKGAASLQQFAMLGSVEGLVADAFGHGRGVHPREYARFHEISGELLGAGPQSIATQLLAIQPGLAQRLERGMIVLEAGCGSGELLVELARRFPRSRFLGIDLSPDAIRLARRSQLRAGTNNLHFEQRNVLDGLKEAQYDLVIACGLLSSSPESGRMISSLHHAMSTDGILLVAERSLPNGNSDEPGSAWDHAYNCMVSSMQAIALGGDGRPAASAASQLVAGLRGNGLRNVRLSDPDDGTRGCWISATAGIPRGGLAGGSTANLRSFHNMPV